jgi:hypothetical protein
MAAHLMAQFATSKVDNRPNFKSRRGIAMSRKVLFGCGMFAALSFCTQGYAAEGKYEGTSCFSGPAEVIQQGEGITAGSYATTAMIPGQEGTPYYMTTGRCLGQFTLINGEWNESGSCQIWNAAGDKIFGVYSRKGDPAKTEGTWHVVQGTGKFEGMTGDGKWIPITAFPPVPNTASACHKDQGTYTVK